MGEYLAHQVKLCKKRKARKDESVKSQAKKSVSSQSAGSPSDSKTPEDPPVSEDEGSFSIRENRLREAIQQDFKEYLKAAIHTPTFDPDLD